MLTHAGRAELTHDADLWLGAPPPVDSKHKCRSRRSAVVAGGLGGPGQCRAVASAKAVGIGKEGSTGQCCMPPVHVSCLMHTGHYRAHSTHIGTRSSRRLRSVILEFYQSDHRMATFVLVLLLTEMTEALRRSSGCNLGSETRPIGLV